MNSDLQLDPLLQALRAAGLRVGISEVLRLRQVFASQPGLAGGEVPRERLRSLLRAVLVKSTEDRGTCDRVCDVWLDRAEEELEMYRVRPQPALAPPSARRHRFCWRSVLQQAAASVVLVALLLTMDKDARVQPWVPPPPDPLAQPQLAGDGEPPPSVTPDDVRKRSFQATVATLEATVRPWHFLLRLEMGLAALAWLGAGGLWLALRRRRLLPEPEPLAPAEGPPRAFPLPVVPAKTVLLAPRDQESLVWGIGRFVSEVPTRRLDLAATVRATALAGGLPEMRFHRARFYREVWLWVDEDAEDPALPRLAAEIETVLAAHGLPVERAAFRGVPHRLVTAAGQDFAPNEIDERRDVALVAILTDGRRLTRRWAADDQRVRIDALLRSLSHWPRLAFVDASRDRHGLAAILNRHSLAVLAPENAAAFLSGTVAPKAMARPDAEVEWGDGAAWAAACALSPAPVDEATALELLRHLGLAASPFALQALRAEAPGPPGRLAWRTADRVRRVSWLCAVEAHPRDTVAPKSLLDRALEFWEDVYDLSLGRSGEDRQETSAERSLRMERALLGLWRGPGGHTADLYRLYQGPLREVIGRHCEVLAPAGWGGPNLIHLPWPWSLPTPVERAMLREMRFGRDMPPVGLRRPGRAWLGIGLLAGLGLAAGALAFQRHLEVPPEILHAEESPAGVIAEAAPTPAGRWRVTVSTRQRDVSREVEAGSRVLVRWRSQQLPCVQTGPAGEEIWLCGRSTAPAPRLPDVSRSTVFLDRRLGTDREELARLALDLLDSGSADVVAIGSYPDNRIPGPIKNQQTLLLTSSSTQLLSYSFPNLAWLQGAQLAGAKDLLRFEGLRPAQEVFPDFKVGEGEPSTVLLRGLGTGCLNTQIEEDGFTFVRICPGTFMMGSQPGDPMAEEDELPAQRETLDEFWMSKFEVTNAQYRKLHADHPGAPDLPATDISWFDARDFCEKLGHRLPTEAEWESAARAGTETPWSFGSDKRDLERFAWFAGNSEVDPHPVGRKEPNPWGLHDMHGNVWEWVEDWYAPYTEEDQENPRGPQSGPGRVLRGGSFFNSAGDLRSAVRVGGRPGDRDRGIGFRCVRGPRRQP
jgi:hypothetical protein